MARGKTLKDCKKIPVSEATQQPTKDGCYELITNHYWQIVDDCILLYRGFAKQCNINESISKRLAGDVGEVRLLERVWLLHECDS